jgi:hypothetical protein
MDSSNFDDNVANVSDAENSSAERRVCSGPMLGEWTLNIWTTWTNSKKKKHF